MKVVHNRAMAVLCAAAMAASGAGAAEPENAEIGAISFGGSVEVLAGRQSAGGEREFSVSLDAFELDVSADLGGGLFMDGALLYEDEEFGVDYARIAFAPESVEGLEIAAGLDYLPFAQFDTGMVTDSMIIDFAETKKGAFGLSYTLDSFAGSLYVFDSGLTGKEDEASFAASLSADTEHFGICASLIGDISEGGLLDAANELAGEGLDYSGAMGYGITAFATLEPVTLKGGYVSSAKEIEFDGDAAKPYVWSVELSASPCEKTTVALRYEKSRDLEILELPERTIGCTVGYDFTENLYVGAEYLASKYDKGPDMDDSRSFSLKVALSF